MGSYLILWKTYLEHLWLFWGKTYEKIVFPHNVLHEELLKRSVLKLSTDTIDVRWTYLKYKASKYTSIV